MQRISKIFRQSSGSISRSISSSSNRAVRGLSTPAAKPAARFFSSALGLAMNRVGRSTYSHSSKYQMLLPAVRCMSSLPSFTVVPMPSLSPTMEAGSIAKWNLKEGDKFGPGTAICEVETDKATVTYEGTEDGYVAKILVGTGEVKVGQPLMITVEDASSLDAVRNASLDQLGVGGAPAAAAKPAAAAAAAAVAVSTPTASATSHPAAVASSSSSFSSSSMSSDRIFASPYARKLAREKNIDINNVIGSGPNNRVLAADVLEGKLKATSSPSASASSSASSSSAASAAAAGATTTVLPGCQDYTISSAQQFLGARFSHAKQVVPHYYLSIDLDMSGMMKIRDQLNSGKNAKSRDADISVMDLLVKAAAIAIRQVPDVNASWMDTFIRKYDQVDINICMDSPVGNILPVIRDVGGKGLTSIANELSSMEQDFVESSEIKDNDSRLSIGTFTIHNLGLYGVKSAAPIVLPPQACALALGTIKDTIVPSGCEKGWKATPVMTVTMSCDHRVVDGAVGAAFLQQYKAVVENPIALLL